MVANLPYTWDPPRGGGQTVRDIAKVSPESLKGIGVADSEYLVADLPRRTVVEIMEFGQPQNVVKIRQVRRRPRVNATKTWPGVDS